MTSTQAFTITPDYPRLPSLLLFIFFPYHNHIHLSCRLRPCHTFFLQNHVLLCTWGNTIASTRCGFPVWTPEYFQDEYFISKVVWWCNLVKVLGQQHRYQRVPSSVTMWQLFHREPTVSSRHHKLLTRQLLPTYMPWRQWGHRPQSRGVLQGRNSNNESSLNIKGQEIQIQQRICFKEIQVFCWDIHN